MAVRRPDLELRVAGRAELEQEVLAAVAQLETRDHLRVTAIQALRQAQDCGEEADSASDIRWKVGILLMRLFRRPPAVVPRHERHHLDLLRLEPAEITILDQIVRVPVVPRIADVNAEVVHEGGVLEPLALPVRTAVDRARLVEESQGETRHLLGMLPEVVAPLRELDRAAATDVRDAIHLSDLPAVAANVVENQALAEREVAEGQVLGAESAEDRVEQHRAGDHEIRTAGVESRDREPLLEVELDDVLAQPADLLGRDAQVADFGRWGSTGRCGRHRAKAENGARGTNHAVEARGGDLLAMTLDLAGDVLHQLPLVTPGQRVALHEAFGEADDADLEAASQLNGGGSAEGNLDTAAADVHHHRAGAAHVDAVDRGQVNQTRLLRAGDDAWADAGLLLDLRKELPAVLGFASCARCSGEDFVDPVRFGKAFEFRQRLERRRHRFRRQRPAVETASAESDHRLFAVDDLEREIGPHEDHDHMDRVGTDIDGGETHQMNGAFAPATSIYYLVTTGTARLTSCLPGAHRQTARAHGPRNRSMDRSAPSELLIRQPLRALEKNLPAAAKGNVDALHQARVASRRIREALPLLSAGSRARRVERQVRKITKALGPVRDLDVALQLLDEMEQTGQTSRSAVARLRQALSRERQFLQADMKRRIEDCDLDKLRKRAIGAVRRSGGGRSPRRDPKRLARAQQRAAQRAGRLRAAIESAAGIYLPDRLHDVRIAVKKLRYAMELVRELSGSRAVARLRTLTAAQDLLGRIHDLEILIARTRGVQGAPGAPNLKLSGELDRLVRRFENECRQLHGHYMARRHSLLSICDHAIAAAGVRAAADAA